MNIISARPAVPILFAMLAVPAWTGISAQELEPGVVADRITVTGQAPADLTGLTEGPEIEGFISARRGEQMEITSETGANTAVLLSNATEIRGRGGFLGLGRTKRAADALLNGLPVSVETVQWNGGLVASRIKFKDGDFQTAAMVRNGTAQRFGEHQVAIEENAAATEALRGRFGDIDKYNIAGSTSVYFDTGKWNLTPAAQRDLCAAAAEAGATENALLLVVGYTDSVGDQDYNQTLSERRAGRVVNHLQQECDWEPWRMLTPTGMAEADPLADNETAAGRAQNRRVTVNILVSKALAGL